MVTGTALAMARHRPRWICRQVNDPRREMRHVFALWARWALRRADCVVGCSQGVRREVIRHLRVSEARVVQLDNLADTRAIARQSLASLPIPRSPGTFTIVHAGRLHAQKNQFLLLDAFATLSGETELWMLGTGPLEARLRAYAQRLGITHRVRWFGFQDNPFPFFRQADCMALTSHFEGLPNVVIEAMVCGTSVVATRCPYGPDELIDHGETGLLVPTNDVAALANALRVFQEQPALRRRLGATARSRATHRFDLERCGQAFERLFESVSGPLGEPAAVAG
jgi:glycosyltransferase involved in cell wall biosynthesis